MTAFNTSGYEVSMRTLTHVSSACGVFGAFKIGLFVVVLHQDCPLLN